jgi:hypothetical protein
MMKGNLGEQEMSFHSPPFTHITALSIITIEYGG